MARPSTYSQPALNTRRSGDKSSTYHQLTHRNSSRATLGSHSDQKTAKKDPDLPSPPSRGQRPSEQPSTNDKLFPGSSSQTSPPGGNYVGIRANNHKDTTSPNMQEIRAQTPVNPPSQGRTLLTTSTQSVLSTPEPHATNEDSKLSGFVSGGGSSIQSPRASVSRGNHVGSLINYNKDSAMSTMQEIRVQPPYFHITNQETTASITGSTQSTTSVPEPRAFKSKEHNSLSTSGPSSGSPASHSGGSNVVSRADDHRPATLQNEQESRVQASPAHAINQVGTTLFTGHKQASSTSQEPLTTNDNKFSPLPGPSSQTSPSVGRSAGHRAGDHKDTPSSNVQETPFQTPLVNPTCRDLTTLSARSTQAVTTVQETQTAQGANKFLSSPESGPQASLSVESLVGPYISDHDDVPLPGMQESPVQSLLDHTTSQERATSSANPTQAVAPSQEHQSAKGDNKFRSFLFRFGSRKTSEPVPSNNPAGHRTSSGSVVRQNPDIDQLKESDTLIALMGPTGSGKSSFIRVAAKGDIGDLRFGIGDDLNSKTADVKTFRIQVPGEDGDIVLVDTPGFDDTHKSDREILEIISNWLEGVGVKHLRLHGVLYLHRISDNRMAGTPLRNLELFRKICGPKWFHRVVLVTTMWDTLWDPKEGEDRVKELRSSFWAGMISAGSRLENYDNTYESVWRILNTLRNDIGKEMKETKQAEQKVKPRLQKETADEGRAVPRTSAGRKLYEQTSELQRQRSGLIRSLNKQIDRLEGEDEVTTLLRDQRDQLKLESEAAEKDLGQLKGGLTPHRKFKTWLKSKEMFSS